MAKDLVLLWIVLKGLIIVLINVSSTKIHVVLLKSLRNTIVL